MRTMLLLVTVLFGVPSSGATGADSEAVKTLPMRDACAAVEQVMVPSTSKAPLEVLGKAAKCLDYLNGYVDGSAFVHALTKTTFVYCKPDEVTNRQRAAVFVKWATDHPETWNQPAAVTLGRAWQETWPCKT